MTRLVDSYDAVKLQFEEASGEVDGQHVLGKVRGEFFFPDGISRNKRYYPRSLWEKVCSDKNIKSKLSERRMFGTISHTQKLDDTALLEGKMSHVVTDLVIQGNKGIGEAFILGTPAGQILNTLLRAGCKLFVSSRADGSFKGEMNGVPVVDPETYNVHTWDFVIDPGFLEANPALVESLNKLAEGATCVPQDNPQLIQGDKEMNGQNSALIESLAKDNGTLKADLEKATTEIETMKNESVVIRDENKHLKFELDKVKGFKAVAEGLKKEIAEYKALGEVADFKALGEAVEKFTKEVGSFPEAQKALVAAEEKIASMGEELKAYRDIGTAARIQTALTKAFEALTEYKAIGTVEEVKKVVETLQNSVTEAKANKEKAAITSLAKELGVTEARIEKLYGKMTEEEIKEFFKGMEESNKISNTYRKVEENKTTTTTTESNQGALGKKDLGSRLMESLGGE